MIRFLLKGLLRDPSRSLFPVITVTLGVMLTVVLYCWIQGLEGEFVKANAKFSTGHVKLATRAYAREADQFPNELAILGLDSIVHDLRHRYPHLLWSPRIRFGGLLDIPDQMGETRVQGPIVGFALELRGSDSAEVRLLNLDKALVQGYLPVHEGEALLSDDLARRFNVRVGETATLISTTRHGSMATANFIVTGPVRFGILQLDRGTMIADLRDMQVALDMSDAAGEILGFYPDELYREDGSNRIAADFNGRAPQIQDEFALEMVTLRNQAGLGQVLDLWEYLTTVLVLIFIAVMSIVLWNAGLMASLRRYGEIGMRLALGEAQGRIFRAMVAESVMVGIIGSILGTAIGLGISYYLEVIGIDVGSMLRNASILLVNVFRARVTPGAYLIGFIPGLTATILGTSIAGIGVFRRQTAQLVRELQS
jgi:putative ABC transport system permease protein